MSDFDGITGRLEAIFDRMQSISGDRLSLLGGDRRGGELRREIGFGIAEVEIDDRTRIAGRLSEERIAGGAMLRIDSLEDGATITRYFSAGAIRWVLITSQDVAENFTMREKSPEGGENNDQGAGDVLPAPESFSGAVDAGSPEP